MEQLKNSLFGISVFASPTALSSTLWYFGSHICPHALCTFSKSKWSTNKGRPPLKDPAVQLSRCSHVKPKQGCTVTACCTYKLKTANSLIHHFNRIQWIRPNRFNYGIKRSPSRTYIVYLCTYICAIHCTESKPSLSGAWRSKVALHRLAQRCELGRSNLSKYRDYRRTTSKAPNFVNLVTSAASSRTSNEWTPLNLCGCKIGFWAEHQWPNICAQSSPWRVMRITGPLFSSRGEMEPGSGVGGSLGG